jgi:hypothetical protein
METRNKLSSNTKELFLQYCESNEIHSVLNVSYKDVAERVIGWLDTQPVEIWNEVIKILDSEILASKGKCFTGRLSRLVSCLDGFHPGVRVKIATSDQISNRVLTTIKKCKEENLNYEKSVEKITQELIELELEESQIKEWIENVKDMFDE